ncbi:MAG: delta-60 repeat domain-containing protein [Rudaea sp.]
MMRSLLLAAFATGTAFDAVAQSIDTFNPMPDGAPMAIALQSDGKIIIASQIQTVGTTPVDDIARLEPDGSLDPDFIGPSAVNGEIKAVAVQADGKILIGGTFDSIDTAAHHHLARLNANGTLDSGFADPNLDQTVWSIAVQPDGKIFVAGDFTLSGSTSRGHLARFNGNGTLDTGFADAQICTTRASSVVLQSNGDVVVGGYFAHIGNCSGAPYHFYLARYSSTGVLDATFPDTAASSAITAIVAGPDDSLYVNGGYAVGTGGIRLAAKLSANGTLVSNYDDLANDGATDSLALQADGKLLIGGTFETVDTQSRHGLARLNANGSLDAGFADLHFSLTNVNANGTIYGLAAQSDGKTIAAGNFTLVNGQPRQSMARVNVADLATSTLKGQASGSNVIVTWTRSGASPELAQPPVLMHSVNGTTYSSIGTMARISTGWQLTAPYNVNGSPFYLRADAYTSSGAGNGSAGRIDSPVYVSDRIFANGFE